MKITTNIMLISAALFFVGCEETSNHEQPETLMSVENKKINDSVPQIRRVYQEGVNIWRASFQRLVDEGTFGTGPLGYLNYFSKEKIEELKGDNPDTSNVNFWIFLEKENDILQFAIANENDTNTFLIYNFDGNSNENSIVSYRDLKPGFDYWQERITSSHGVFVNVKRYRYTWENLFNSMGGDSDTLILETVAQSVETRNPWFEVSANTDESGVLMEGYVAIDILISGNKNSGGSSDDIAKKSNMYDFAMPCPKFCPK